MEQTLHKYVLVLQIAWDICVPKKYSLIWNSIVSGHPISLLARSGNPPSCEHLNGTHHIPTVRLQPRLLISSSQNPLKGATPAIVSGILHGHTKLCAQSVAVDASQTLKFSLPTLSITCLFPSMEISWAPLPQCVLWKELLYLAEWLLFHNTQPQVHGSVPVPCLWSRALMVSFLHEVQRCASQANSDLSAWLSSPSAGLWYAYIRLASVTPRPSPFPQGPFSYLPHSLWRCSAHINLTQQF